MLSSQIGVPVLNTSIHRHTICRYILLIQTVLQFGLKTSQLNVLLTSGTINKPVNAILILIAYVSREGPSSKGSDEPVNLCSPRALALVVAT